MQPVGEGDGAPLQSSCLENPGTGEPAGLQPVGEGDGAPLQSSCLESLELCIQMLISFFSSFAFGFSSFHSYL